MTSHLPACEQSESTLNYNVIKAIKQLKLPSYTNDLLVNAYRELRVEIPIRRDNGQLDVFYGYRVQHNGALGPYKGGIRFHPMVTLNEVRDLASAMTWKTALLQLPFGGGKGGVICDPKSLSERELEALMRGYASKISLIIGPHRDVPAPDMNTSATMMAWFMDEYGKRYGYTPAVVTGKPLELGGSKGRSEATGRGVFYVLREYYRAQGRSLNEVSVAVQGFGKVGFHAARLLHEAGAKVVAVSRSSGGTYNPEGLDIHQVKQFNDESGQPLNAYPEGEAISNSDLLTLDVDCLIPAALGHVIDESNAHNIKARVIAEAANLPVTEKAEAILTQEFNTAILPDILINAGGVTVSYFEWVQNLQQFSWEIGEVNNRLEKKMSEAFQRVQQRMETTSGLTYREACYQLAVERVHKASELRGYTNSGVDNG